VDAGKVPKKRLENCTIDLTQQWVDRSAWARLLRAGLGDASVGAWLSMALDPAGPPAAQITVRWVGQTEGQALNASYRNKDHATNVLTFDYARAPIVAADLVLCVPVLVREALGEAPRPGASALRKLRAHAAHLLIHGFLHAQGLDHERGAREARTMENLEMLLLHALGFDNPYSV
jgi:probable rRNA maturation factor